MITIKQNIAKCFYKKTHLMDIKKLSQNRVLANNLKGDYEKNGDSK